LQFKTHNFKYRETPKVIKSVSGPHTRLKSVLFYSSSQGKGQNPYRDESLLGEISFLKAQTNACFSHILRTATIYEFPVVKLVKKITRKYEIL
jgi:hypothetical protein